MYKHSCSPAALMVALPATTPWGELPVFIHPQIQFNLWSTKLHGREDGIRISQKLGNFWDTK